MPSSSPRTPLLTALAAAETRRGFCAPNPAVGAAVVCDGEIIAVGCHQRAGSPHAEVEALKNVPAERARRSEIFVTLEPCCHRGRTPPCTEFLIERGVRRVTFGFLDPNPRVAGRGQRRLLEAGIECVHEPDPQLDEFYRSYAHWTRHQRPWVTAKIALSLDGKIAGPSLSGVHPPLPLSGPESALFTHVRRRRSDAILTTARTVRADDPRLNARTEDGVFAKPIYVVDARLELAPRARVRNTASPLTLFCAETTDANTQAGVRVIPVPSHDGRLSLAAILEQIGRDGMHDLWVEGGGALLRSLLSERLLDRAYLYLTPQWVGREGLAAFGDAPSPIFEGARTITWSGQGTDGLAEVNW